MNKIHTLSEEVISKIAAGEVIERPASVVKELIENSIDAETDSIELRVKNAGRTLICVKDTGAGIAKKDFEKLFQRHSTSKIKNIDDIHNIASLGFRGEALYSIASIADVFLRSKTKEADCGWEIRCRGLKKESFKPFNLNTGTEIEIKELFFNTPARRKFLKSDSTELNRIINIFLPYCLLYPHKRFALFSQDRQLVNLNRDENYLKRIAKCLHLDEKNLIEVKTEFPEINAKVHLVLGGADIQRVNRDQQFIFVNVRPVQNRSLSFHINQIYRLIIEPQLFPVFCVYINLPAGDIDVNVHPAKREVKIKDEYNLISRLRPLIEKTLTEQSQAKQLREAVFEMPQGGGANQSLDKDCFAPLRGARNDDMRPAFGPSVTTGLNNSKEELIKSTVQHLDIFKKEDGLKNKLGQARFVGIFLEKYLLFEAENSLLIIDQHAASERINFEKLKRQIEDRSVEVQNLLAPILVSVSTQEKLIWEESAKKLEEIGLSTTLWDAQSVAIHSHPAAITNPEIALRNLLSCEGIADCDTEALARRACRQSVMAGDKLDKDKADYLRRQLLKCSSPFSCPHGRPVVIEIQETSLNKQFLR